MTSEDLPGPPRTPVSCGVLSSSVLSCCDVYEVPHLSRPVLSSPFAPLLLSCSPLRSFPVPSYPLSSPLSDPFLSLLSSASSPSPLLSYPLCSPLPLSRSPLLSSPHCSPILSSPVSRSSLSCLSPLSSLLPASQSPTHAFLPCVFWQGILGSLRKS